MKIEMVPWLKEHATDVDMDKLYTELIVEHVCNEPQGETRTKINDYRELFEENLGSSHRQVTVLRLLRKRGPKNVNPLEFLLKVGQA